MLSKRLALALAVLGGILTLLIGFLQDIRPLTIGYRSFVSAVVFGVCGFLLGNTIDSYQQRAEEDLNAKGQTIDIISKDDDSVITPPEAESTAETGFRPFSPETFDRVSGK
ncbi:MAG: hypothetical protein P4N41_24250 [Negativicutes bacterium]|nr:hypothetical protein [Negativicutes bacterium]